ncbi:hypothetical protein L1987_20850 [Smallanthus sonchifolius]|uniref:Uncharacterized protein n=1 Tax=Smallanthus sonchifolius TaxID=185202 RepID=A0ACB9ISC9_9ASTR|nr:hypothetical protein L1987_20850 [Smallanthus sonchifolius]
MITPGRKCHHATATRITPAAIVRWRPPAQPRARTSCSCFRIPSPSLNNIQRNLQIVLSSTPDLLEFLKLLVGRENPSVGVVCIPLLPQICTCCISTSHRLPPALRGEPRNFNVGDKRVAKELKARFESKDVSSIYIGSPGAKRRRMSDRVQMVSWAVLNVILAGKDVGKTGVTLLDRLEGHMSGGVGQGPAGVIGNKGKRLVDPEVMQITGEASLGHSVHATTSDSGVFKAGSAFFAPLLNAAHTLQARFLRDWSITHGTRLPTLDLCCQFLVGVIPLAEKDFWFSIGRQEKSDLGATHLASVGFSGDQFDFCKNGF